MNDLFNVQRSTYIASYINILTNSATTLRRTDSRSITNWCRAYSNSVYRKVKNGILLCYVVITNWTIKKIKYTRRVCSTVDKSECLLETSLLNERYTAYAAEYGNKGMTIIIVGYYLFVYNIDRNFRLCRTITRTKNLVFYIYEPIRHIFNRRNIPKCANAFYYFAIAT